MFQKISILGIFLSLFWGEGVYAQGQYAYKVNFRNKNNTPYRLTSPEYYLSERSIIRRYNQGIPIDSTDLPVNSSYVDSVLTVTGGILHEVSKWENLVVVLVTETDTGGLFSRLDSIAFIKSIQIVGYYNPALHLKHSIPQPSTGTLPQARKTTSDATYYSNTWGQTHLINGNSLYDMGYTGTGMMISILDAGFDKTNTCPYGFDSLRNSGRIVDVHNFSYANDNVYGYDNHGTMVLSTMAAYVPDTFVGSAPLAMYALYITEIDPTEQPMELINLLCGAERADSVGTDIITCSLGYNTFDNSIYNFNFSTDFDGKTTIAAKAANIATQKGILFVASAGNEGGDSWNMILTPGDADSALTIGNVDPYSTIVYNSGYGPNAAGQVKPDVCAQGGPASVIDGNVYTSGPGTSFSTPQIAGWAACLWEANPTATPYQLRLAIDKCASMYGTPDAHYGYGIANFGCSEQMLKVNNLYPKQEGLAVFPNPFNEELFIDPLLNATQAVSIRIMDVTGRTLINFERNFSSGANPPFSINTQSLPQGIYFLHIVSETQQKVIKVVKD